MTTLILAEHDNQHLDASLRHVLSAAQKLSGDVHVLVAGQGCASVAGEATKIPGVSKVLFADGAEYKESLAENIAPLIVSLADAYSHILAPSSSFGKDVLPRAAALLDVAQISDIVAVESPDIFVRPIYAGNALATVQSSDAKKIITVRKVAFDAVSGEQPPAPIENVAPKGASPLACFVGLEATKSERPELTSARVVVSGGRGVGSKENFAVIESLADALNGA
ncbi:MAG: FAD-binding protein, partial [Alphaproteobacteria bacterium]|nr:FAD-binding protein [Alphaproteobacteria bacterium]